MNSIAAKTENGLIVYTLVQTAVNDPSNVIQEESFSFDEKLEKASADAFGKLMKALVKYTNDPRTFMEKNHLDTLAYITNEAVRDVREKPTENPETFNLKNDCCEGKGFTITINDASGKPSDPEQYDFNGQDAQGRARMAEQLANVWSGFIVPPGSVHHPKTVLKWLKELQGLMLSKQERAKNIT